MVDKTIEEYRNAMKKWIDIQEKELEGNAMHFICKLNRKERDRLRKKPKFRKMRELKEIEFIINDSGNLARPELKFFMELYWFDTGSKNMTIHQLFENQVDPKEIFFPHGRIEVEPATHEHFEKAKRFMTEVIPVYMLSEWIENEVLTCEREIKHLEEGKSIEN